MLQELDRLEEQFQDILITLLLIPEAINLFLLAFSRAQIPGQLFCCTPTPLLPTEVDPCQS